MAKIIGNTTATPNLCSDWNQTDATKVDYIKNKPTILTEEDITKLIVSRVEVSDVPVVYILPEDAKDGDMCHYAPQNTLTLADSGGKFYINWEEFRKPVPVTVPNYMPHVEIYSDSGNVSMDLTRNDSQCFLNIECELLESGYYNCGVAFIDGVFKAGQTETNGEVTVFNSIEELPKFFQLPQFSEIFTEFLDDSQYLFHTDEYRLMKYQGGEWSDAVPTKTSDLINDSGFISKGGIPAVYTLPIDAKEGDMCLYALKNEVTTDDSGKRIYFNWEEFRKPLGAEEYTVGGFTCQSLTSSAVPLEMSISRTPDYQVCNMIRQNISGETSGFIIVFYNGKLVTEESNYGNSDGIQGYYNSIDELPRYIDLPRFDSVICDVQGNNDYLFNTEYKLMKHQGGEWVDVDLTTKQVEDLEANTAARHEHINKNILDRFGLNGIDLSYYGNDIRFKKDGNVIESYEVTDEQVVLHLSPVLNDSGLEIQESIVIPIGSGNGGDLPLAPDSGGNLVLPTETDPTLTMEGVAADAKATGDRFAEHYTKQEIDDKGFATTDDIPTTDEIVAAVIAALPIAEGVDF